MSVLRCAIYTRKSSEEGLEQGFNSLHAQREACAAYVLSQAGEGWKALPAEYDDGGFSGGNMERPGLKQLLADIDAGRIDIVVVYKVDRLTRSLSDFSKIVDRFDARQVSFVSVTQAFNTTTSMGRLTLNMLLSFAQFEREVTGERIRDKIAASKAKGMWMGGVPPLGYDPPADPNTRTLVVNAAEAKTVRLIFQQYLALGSVHALRDWLEAQDIRSKAWTNRRGVAKGGLTFSRGALFHLLRNRLYRGQIVHKGQVHPGAHCPIVEAGLFETVQQSLDAKASRQARRPTRAATMALKGKIFDAAGQAMSPTFTHRPGGRLYRYYVSASLQQGGSRPKDDDAIGRVSAPLIETLVFDVMRRLGSTDASGAPSRVEVHPACVHLFTPRAAFFPRPLDVASELAALEDRLDPGERIVLEDGGDWRFVLPRRLKVQGGKTHLCGPNGAPIPRRRPDAILVKALRSSHAILAGAGGSPVGRPELAAPMGGIDNPYHRSLARLAFLAPDLQARILEGRQPAGMTLQTLLKTSWPLAWDDQRHLFGPNP